MSRATRILLSLVAGLVGGVALAAASAPAAGVAIAVAGPVGTAWLNGLQMTVVPLVVSLLVTGVAETAEAAGAGRVTARMVTLIVAAVLVTGTVGALVTPLILEMFPVPVDAAAALRGALATAGDVPAPPAMSDFFTTLVPTNVVSAAANSAFLPLIVFTLAFAFAATRIGEAERARIVELFRAVRDATLVLIDWVLWLAPIGVFALALVVGARAGLAAFGALVHYILVISSVGVLIVAASYVLGSVGGRVSPMRFARALLPVQAVAISTQSSLACLPAMLKAATGLGATERTAGVALPLAVAMFRATQPAMNIAICLYIAHWFGRPVAPGQLMAAVAVAALVSLGSVSLPAQITLFASVAPPAVVLGLPLEPIGLFIAVETIPDIFRTLGNASMDLAATMTVSAREDRGEHVHEVPITGT